MTNPPILTPEFVIYDPLCSRCRKLAGRDAAGVPPDAALCVGHLRRRAAEDAATIARLREHLALSEQHKLVAIESRRDREAELARLTQERDELDVQLTSTADELRRVFGELTEAEAALATLREATTWQPMSTAPKDGRAFLAATRFLGQPCVERIYWDRGWKGAQGEQRFDAWMPLPPPPPEDQEPR